MKNADFARKFEEWYIQNPDECYGEMNYTNNEADIRLSCNKYQRMHNNGRATFMNVFCVLAGIIVLLVNVIIYATSFRSVDIYYDSTIFWCVTAASILIMLLPLKDAIGGRREIDRLINDTLSSGFANMNCGCRFYNGRVEFISCREHVIYAMEDIEYIYECTDGLYFMLYSGGMRYIPARFFDREFAYIVTERLSVTGLDIYRRREYMAVSAEAAAIEDFEPPVVESCDPLVELNYIIDRRFAMMFTGCGRVKLPEMLHFAAAGILGIFVIYMIFFRDMPTLLNWGILILDVIYILIGVMLHLSGTHLECERYTGQYIVRFFEGHMSIVSGNSVYKTEYCNIPPAESKKDCMILKINCVGGIQKLIIPHYAVSNLEELQNFLQSVGLIQQ